MRPGLNGVSAGAFAPDERLGFADASTARSLESRASDGFSIGLVLIGTGESGGRYCDRSCDPDCDRFGCWTFPFPGWVWGGCGPLNRPRRQFSPVFSNETEEM